MTNIDMGAEKRIAKLEKENERLKKAIKLLETNLKANYGLNVRVNYERRTNNL